MIDDFTACEDYLASFIRKKVAASGDRRVASVGGGGGRGGGSLGDDGAEGDGGAEGSERWQGKEAAEDEGDHDGYQELFKR